MVHCGGFTWSTDINGNYIYSCTKKWTGFAGANWQGGVTFLPPNSPTAGNATTVCANSSNSPPTVLPTGYNVTSTINDNLATVNPNSISFTDVALGVTNITIHLNAEASSCNRLSTPNLQWAAGGNPNTPRDLTWIAITGASSYTVYKCEVNSSADCGPNESTSQTGLSKTPSFNTSAAGTTTQCYKVIATESSATFNPSNESATKCMTETATQKNNGTLSKSYSIR